MLPASPLGRPPTPDAANPETLVRDVKRLVLAVEAALDLGDFAGAESLARQGDALEFVNPYFRSVLLALDTMPEAVDPVFDAFVDDRASDVQVIPRVGASTTLMVFCAGDRATLPLKLIHRWFGRLGVHVVYLRDRGRCMYMNGVQSFGLGPAKTAQALRRIARELSGERILCFGGSKGGYGALLHAVPLQAEAVLVQGAPTRMDDAMRAHFGLGTREGVDLRRLYADSGRLPRAHLVYAGDMVRDHEQAVHLQGLPTVSLEAVPGVGHHSIALDLIRIGRLEHLLNGLANPHIRARTWPAAGGPIVSSSDLPSVPPGRR